MQHILVYNTMEKYQFQLWVHFSVFIWICLKSPKFISVRFGQLSVVTPVSLFHFSLSLSECAAHE